MTASTSEIERFVGESVLDFYLPRGPFNRSIRRFAHLLLHHADFQMNISSIRNGSGSFGHWIKDQTGRSPGCILRECRLIHCLFLLWAGNSVSSSVKASGLGTPRTFESLCMEHFGTSPRTIKRSRCVFVRTIGMSADSATESLAAFEELFRFVFRRAWERHPGWFDVREVDEGLRD